jgi:HSP20 family protein
MSLVRYNPLPSLLNNFFNAELNPWNAETFSDAYATLPAVNIKETADTFEVEVAAPGFSKEDFKIELNNNVLTVSSEKQEENAVEDEKFTKREFSYQAFKRSFTLPELVEEDKISAKYVDGVLDISIPKKEEAKLKKAKQIEIM